MPILNKGQKRKVEKDFGIKVGGAIRAGRSIKTGDQININRPDSKDASAKVEANEYEKRPGETKEQWAARITSNYEAEKKAQQTIPDETKGDLLVDGDIVLGEITNISIDVESRGGGGERMG